MAWVKLDDQLPLNTKMRALTVEGRYLFVTSLCWCAMQMNDGTFPATDIPSVTVLAGVPQNAAEQLSPTLWHTEGTDCGPCAEVGQAMPVPSGHIAIHCYLERNESRAQVENRRRQDRPAMLAIADEEALYLLEFVERRGLEREIERLRNKLKAAIVPGDVRPIHTIRDELKAYFNGTLKEFKTPIRLLGSPFQKRVWEELMRIPYGQTRSYAEQAKAMGQATAYRAVANANGANQLAIIIPCHRIINTNGELGGYGGGIKRVFS